MLDELPHNEGQPAPLSEGMKERLSTVLSILKRIDPDPDAHRCPGNSPCGHHDVEAIGEKAVLCHAFKFCCPHPLTEDSPEELPDDTLLFCIDELRDLRILSSDEHQQMRREFRATHRSLWTIDVSRRQVVAAWSDTMRRHGKQESIPSELPILSHDLDERFLPEQQSAVSIRLALLQKLQELASQGHAFPQPSL